MCFKLSFKEWIGFICINIQINYYLNILKKLDRQYSNIFEREKKKREITPLITATMLAPLVHELYSDQNKVLFDQFIVGRLVQGGDQHFLWGLT